MNAPAPIPFAPSPHEAAIAMTRQFRRPLPPDFADNFIEHGHDRILEELYRTSWQMVVHWISLLPDDVIAAREEHLRRTRWPNGRPGPKRRRYVLGLTLTSKRRDGA